jgi:5'-nucleotidase/UDP-sugar diphosphatase
MVDRGGVALMAATATQLRARAPDRTLLLDAGDTWQGTFISNADKGAALVQVMNRMGYDAQALGNHDFDWGQDVLRSRAREASFPFLAANVVDVASGAVPGYAKPYVVKDLGVTRVAIVGIANPGTPAINKPNNVSGLRFLPAADAVRRHLPEMRAQADVLIALSHIGRDDDLALAQQVPELDLIIGGHSHTALTTALTQGRTTIAQAGSSASFLGRLEVTIDASKRVAGVARSDALISLVSGRIDPDPEVAKIVAARASETRALTERVVGKTLVDLESQSAGEFPLGNLIVDAMLDYCRAKGWQSHLALHNNSGIRSGLSAGDITYGEIYRVLPFDNAIVNLELSGAQVSRILERTVSGRPGNLLIAGGAYSFRAGAESGKRLASVTIQGAPLDPAARYRVCTIDYLALGGDDQTTFREGTNLIYGDLAADVVADYLLRRSPVSPKIEGRIQPQG